MHREVFTHVYQIEQRFCSNLSSSQKGQAKEKYKNYHYEYAQLSWQKGITNREKGITAV